METRIPAIPLTMTRKKKRIAIYLTLAVVGLADPGKMEVIIEDARDSENPWMHTPVELIQWAVLGGAK